jgi:DNA primase
MDSQIEEIKNKLDIVDLVGSYVKLTRTGINYRGICPFHSEKGPSFFVSPTRQMWHCFGCGLGGSIFDFIMKIDGVEFGDALRILAKKAGVELKKENPKLRTERQRMYEICEWSASFFEKQLSASDWGKKAKDYLLKRGIQEETIKKWRLGYSPDTWQGLSDFLVGRGYNRDEIVKAGLAVSSEKGTSNSGRTYDRFRGRIIFPIFDANAQVVGFGARIFSDRGGSALVGKGNEVQPKYINTPATMLYDKSNILYGINNAKLAIRKNNQCVLTEGYTDAIMCHQAGFENTVAVSGTALTGNHLNLLKRYTDNLLLAFDMDLAGDSATKRGINLAENQGFNIKIIDTYSNAKDPAEIILENPKNWDESVKNARAIMDYYFDTAFSHFDKKSAQGKKEISRIILPAVKRIPNKIEQSHWTQKLSQMLEVSPESVIEELKNIKMESIPDTGNTSGGLPYSQKSNNINNFTEEGRKRLLEEQIISLILKNPYNLNLIKQPEFCMFSEKNRDILEELNKISAPVFVSDEPNIEEKLKAMFADISKSQEYKDYLDGLFFKAEVEFEDDGDNEFELCLLQLKKLELKNELCRLSGELKKDLNCSNEECLKEFDKKAKELHFNQKK